MKLFFSVYLSSCFILVLSGCRNVKKDHRVEDTFYTQTYSSWDAVRVPMIKPYELIKLNGSKEWTMNFQEIVGSASNIKDINVINGIIIIHSGETYCNYKKVKEAWFVIVPNQHKEQGFEKKEEFDNYLLSLDIHEPKFFSTGRVYEQFYKFKKIDWQIDFK